MTKQKDTEAIKKAIEVLIREGRKSYTDPAFASDAAAFGQAISSVNDDTRFLIEAAAEHCEDWNHHGVAAILRAMANN